MKLKIVETVVPEQIKQSTYYICENCNTKYKYNSAISTCKICGKDVCTNCQKWLPLATDYLYFDKSDKTLTLHSDTHAYSGSIKLCEDCYNKIIVKEELYIDKVDTLINDFNKKMKQLERQYLDGNL